MNTTSGILVLTMYLFAQNVVATTWTVGPTRPHTLPSEISNLVADGDTVAIDAGVYDDCTTWSRNDLLIHGVGGIAHLQNSVCDQKGVFVLYGNNITVENMELSGAAISSALGSNAAGVRAQGGSVTLRHCFIHHNQMGVLQSATGPATVRIEECVIAANVSADQSLFAHNIYINTCDTFVLTGSYVHGAQVGHNVRIAKIVWSFIVRFQMPT